MKVSLKNIEKCADKLGVNLDVISLETLKIGVEIEFEHGNVDRKTNVTNNDLVKTMKIALAHLNEFPDYYTRLLKLEIQADKYWKKRRKPSIWL